MALINKKRAQSSTQEFRNGFTLVELIIVISVIGILVAFAVPNFLDWLPNMRLKAAARDLYSNMQKAKIAAIKSNTTVTFSFTPGTGSPCKGGSYKFVDGNGKTLVNVTLSDDVCLDPTSSFPNGFSARGLASGTTGTLKLSHPDTSRTYTVTQSIAGNIKLQ